MMILILIVWALIHKSQGQKDPKQDQPLSLLLKHQARPTNQLLVRTVTFNYLCTYDLYSSVHNVLDAWISITRGRGRGLGPRIWEFFGPQIALAYRLDAISQGPKNSRIPGPNPLPLPQVMNIQKHYAQGCINHRCIGCFMHKSPLVTLTGCFVGRSRAHLVWCGGAGE